MKIEQIYTGCLAQGAYYIVSEGEAIIIDPLRETGPYISRLNRDKVRLKYIFETHFHADFVSGHLELSEKTGAKIVYGPLARPAFKALIAEDGQLFRVGELTLKAIHTPGHTLESTCYLLLDEVGESVALFSGDTLFLGDVGRPDLAQKAVDMTQDALAALLYDSLYNKLLHLPDTLIVYPAHGAGSACGKNMMQVTKDTLGNQKKVNYALNQPSKAAFVEAVLDGLQPAPAYFKANVALNKNGAQHFDAVLDNGMKRLSASAFELLAEQSGALILDTRLSSIFAEGFIPHAINIGIKGSFAPWVGAMVGDTKQPILLVTEKGMAAEVVTRLSRIGFDQVLGFLEGGFETWLEAGKEVDQVHRISVEAFEEEFKQNSRLNVFDIRKLGEYEATHIKDAWSRPLAAINNWVKELNSGQHFYIHCAGGYRSMIAASILQSRGYRNFSEVEGGFKAIENTIIPKTDYVCSTKLFK